MAVTKDATSGRYIPQTAAEWTTLLAGTGISPPDSLWRCQEASGNLADSIGSAAMVASGSPTYANVVSGWTSRAVDCADASTQFFRASGPNIGGSVMVFAWIAFPASAPSLRRSVITLGAAYGTQLAVNTKVNSNPTLIALEDHGDDGTGSGGGTGTSTYTTDPVGGGVHPVLAQGNVTAHTAFLSTDLEQVIDATALSGADALDGFVWLGGNNAQNWFSGGNGFIYAAAWFGSHAEISAAQGAALVTLLMNSSPAIASIAVSPSSVALTTGGSQQLTATATLSDSSTEDVTSTATWTSDTRSVATVSSSGLVTAVAPGTSTISATQSSVSGTCSVVVTAAPVASPTPTFSIVMRPAPASGANNILLSPGTSASSSVTTDPGGMPFRAPTTRHPFPIDVLVNPGKTLAALQAGSAAIKYVVAIEGYPNLLTDADPTKAVVAWSNTDYTQALDGLFVELDNQQTLDPWEPFQGGGTCKLSVLPDAADTFGIDVHRAASGAEALLTAPCNRYGTPMSRPLRVKTGEVNAEINEPLIVVDNGSDFVAGDAFIGTECISVAGPGNAMFVSARGKYSPFGSGGAGGNRFAQHHRITTDPQGVLLNPTVSQQPRVWIGRWIGVWMHTVDGNGTLNAQTDAQCVFMGKIAGIGDDADTGCTVVDCEHVLDVIKDITLGRDMFSATIPQGWYIAAGLVFTFGEGATGVANAVANNLSVVASGATGTNQINAGYYTLEEICSFLNAWLAGEKSAGRIVGQYTWASPVTGNGGLHTKCYWFYGATSTIEVVWGLTMDLNLYSYLGLNNAWDSTVQVTAGLSQAATNGGLSNTNNLFQGADTPWRMVAFTLNTSPETIQLNVSNCIGTMIDQYALIPSSNRLANPLGLKWGCFLVNEQWLMLATFDQQATVTTFSNCLVFDYVVPGVQPGPQTLASFGTKADASTDTTDVPVRQVYLLEATFAELIKQIFYGTGSTNYNSPTFDNLGYGLGIGIPGSVLGPPFELSVDNQPGWSNAMVCVIDEPTKVSDLLGADLVLRHSFPMWRSDGGVNGTGGLAFGRWQTPVGANAVAALTEDNKANPVGNQASYRTASVLDATWVKNIIKIDYNRDFTVSKDGTYQSSLTFEDETAVDDSGGASEPFTIEARNTYAQYLGTGAGIESLAPAFLDTLPLFSRPCRKATRPIDQRYFEGLHIGDIVILDDTFMRDPETGTRGVSGREALVTRLRYNPGGAAPGTTQVTAQAGEVDLVFLDAHRWADFAPSAFVDATQANAGYSPLANTLALVAHAYSEPTEPEDWTYFVVGDVIRITEADPTVPAAALTWQATVLATAENQFAIDRALGGWDATKNYRITFDRYSQIAPLQQEDAFQATAASGKIEGVAQPYQLSSTNEPGSTSANNDVAELLPTIAYGDGRAFDVGSERALIGTLNILIDSKTAHQSPMLARSQNYPTQPARWELLFLSPIYFGLDSISSSVSRFVNVAPLYTAGDATGSIRITLAQQMPTQQAGTFSTTDAFTIAFNGIYQQATWNETSTFGVPVIGAPQTLSLSAKDANGLAWLALEVFGNISSTGIAQCREGIRTNINLR